MTLETAGTGGPRGSGPAGAASSEAPGRASSDRLGVEVRGFVAMVSAAGKGW